MLATQLPVMPTKGISATPVQFDVTDRPDPADLEFNLGEVMQLYHELLVYRQEAQQIDDEFLATTRKENLTLEDMPYGEELIRTRGLPRQVERAIQYLESVDDEGVSAAMANERFQAALSASDDARRTLDDCKRLPVKPTSDIEDE